MFFIFSFFAGNRKFSIALARMILDRKFYHRHIQALRASQPDSIPRRQYQPSNVSMHQSTRKLLGTLMGWLHRE